FCIDAEPLQKRLSGPYSQLLNTAGAAPTEDAHVSAGPERTEPAAPASPATPLEPPTTPEQASVPAPPPAPAAPVGPSLAAFGGSESCPSCGARRAANQRYSLNCGHRRGDPRLPFMDAVVFMESMSAPGGTAGTPPPPPPSQRDNGGGRWNANAA